MNRTNVVNKGMLTWKRETVWSDTDFFKDTSELMETLQCRRHVGKIFSCVCRATCKVREINECGNALDHLVRYVSDDGRQKDLSYKSARNAKGVIPTMVKRLRTFISALESFPVHCEKLRPFGKRRRPGKEGVAARLYRETSTRCQGADSEVTYRLSMSSRTRFASAAVGAAARTYSSTQVTTWSLNVPLMS